MYTHIQYRLVLIQSSINQSSLRLFERKNPSDTDAGGVSYILKFTLFVICTKECQPCFSNKQRSIDTQNLM